MARITPQEALQRVSSATQQGMRLAASKTKKSVITEYVRDVDENVYLFRKGKEGLILPSDDAVMPILGESEQADFSVELPAHVEEFFKGYANEIANIDDVLVIDDDVPEEVAAATPRKDVPYLVKTTWGQGEPYNDKLDFGEGKCKVGCASVMLSQILHYWGTKGYHRGCMATPRYQWSGYPLVAATDALTMFDYANLTTGTPKTAAQIEAVSEMLARVGFALKLKYGINSTAGSTTTIAQLAKQRLRLGKGMKLITAFDLTNAGFEEAIYQELSQGCPVGFVSNVYSNDKYAGGHAFVCDGYRAKDNKFHLNFGWERNYDGYYALTAIDLTRTYNMNNGHGAYVGIKPDYKLGDANRDGSVNITDAMVAINHGLKGTYDEAADVNGDGKVTIADSTPIINHILGKEKL